MYALTNKEFPFKIDFIVIVYAVCTRGEANMPA